MVGCFVFGEGDWVLLLSKLDFSICNNEARGGGGQAQRS